MMNKRAMEMLSLSKESLHNKVKFLTYYSEMIKEEGNIQKWERTCASGTALLQAAQTAWFFDEHKSHKLLHESAMQYMRVGLPYGVFLLSLTSDESQLNESLQSPWVLFSLEKIAGSDRIPAEKELHGELASYALQFPSQQIYLVLSVLGSNIYSKEYSGILGKIVDHLQSHSNQPIGPQGISLETYSRVVQIAQKLHQVHGDMSTEILLKEMEPVLDIGHRYADSVKHGMTCEYLWENMHSPVELVDFDAAGLILRITELVGYQTMEALLQKRLKLKGLASIPFMISMSFMKWRGLEDGENHDNNHDQNPW